MKCILRQHNMEVPIMSAANDREYRKCTHCDFKWYADGNAPEWVPPPPITPTPEKVTLFDLTDYPRENKQRSKYRKIG